MDAQVQYDFHQLPSTAQIPLRDSLISFIKRYAQGSRPVLIALCVAVSSLAIQMTTWTSVLDDMTSVLSGDADNWGALLQFLSVLPEEFSGSRKVSLTDAQLQERSDTLLTNNTEQILQLLSSYAQSIQNIDDANPLLMSCVASWLREIPIAKVMNTPLLDLTFQALSREQLFDEAVDLLCTIFRETNEVNDPDMVQIINALFPKLMSLRSRISASKDDIDTFRGYARLFSEAGEAWVILIARMPQQFKPLVEAIAETASIDEDLEVVKFTFIFWYDLKQALLSPRYHEAKLAYAPIYSELVDIMIKHLHYPAGAEVNDLDLFSGDRDAEDKFRDFRHEMGDVLKDACNVVGGSICLGKAFNKVQALMELGKTQAVQWQDIEAPLFSMRAMAREISLEEENVLPHIMNTLLVLPEHPKIRYAATLVLGRYTEWTAVHPDYLLPQLNYITSGFAEANPDVISAAAQALKHFCRDCSRLLVNHIEQLYGFYAQMLPSLDFESAVEVTEGIGHVVLAQPQEKLYLALKSFTDPIASRIAEISSSATTDEITIRKLADEIELLTVFAFTVKPYIEDSSTHPCVRVFEEIWPTLSSVLDSHGSQQFISEKVCSCLKTILNNYRQHTRTLLPSFAEKLAECFQKYKYGCFLWVSGACVRQFSNVDENRPDTVNAVWRFVEIQSVSMFQYLSTQEPKKISDVVEDFFRLMTDALHGNPQQFLDSQYLETVVQACQACLTIEQVEALTTLLRFLRDLLGWLSASPPTSGQHISDAARAKLSNVVLQSGGSLTNALFLGQVWRFPRDCISDASGALLIMIETQPSNALSWIQASISSLPAGSVGEQEAELLLQNMQISCQTGDLKRARSQLQDFTSHYRRRTAARDTINEDQSSFKYR